MSMGAEGGNARERLTERKRGSALRSKWMETGLTGSAGKIGGAEGDRTPDLLNAIYYQ